MKLIRILFLIVIMFPGKLKAQVVNINNGLQLVTDGTINLVIENGGLKNDGIFIHDSSTVIFTGGASTAISGSQPITFYNLTFRGTGLKTNAGDVSVVEALSVENTTTLDADGPANDKPFTLKSSDTATAYVAILTTGNINGNVTVERHINTGVGPGEHGKSWQFLATPTTGQTVFQSWQENGAVPPGYGTWIIGSGTGFDASSVLPSLKYYNPATDNWTAITNTGNQLTNPNGYMLFVRGDRSVVTYNGTPNNTNMRSKGILFTPSNPPPSVTVSPNLFQSFGNPYASRIHFNNVYIASTGINNVFHAWDPMLNGSYNLGGYQTISAVAGYIPTAGNATTYYPAGVPAPYIESGQAVFVQGSAGGGTVNFNETCKVGGSRLVHKGNEYDLPTARKFLFNSLFTNTGQIADGNIVAFESGLRNEINEFDASKIMNQGENFGLWREGKRLAVEAREPVEHRDTIFYYFTNLRKQAYTLLIAPVNFETNLNAFFVDQYLQTKTPVSLQDSAYLHFTINADPASAAPNRFYLIFRPGKIPPVRLITIDAQRNKDKTNWVKWEVDNESGISEYHVEHSNNGLLFKPFAKSSPFHKSGRNTAHLKQDDEPFAETFYRVKAISSDGSIQYSKIVKLEIKDDGISVYPNPVTNKQITIRFSGKPKGSYTLRLINHSGQVVFQQTIFYDQIKETYKMEFGPSIIAGNYLLSVTKPDGSQYTESLLIR